MPKHKLVLINMPKHSLCSLSSIAFTVQKLENRAFVIVSILSRLADALVRVGISRFCLMCRRRAPSLATLARWRRFVRLYTVYEEALSEFTLSSQVLKFFAGRRRSAAAARRQNVERAPGWRGGRIRGPARIGGEGCREAGSEPGPGSEPGVAEAESSESSTACELPGPRARHRTRCCVGCSSGAVVWYDPFDTKTHHCYLLRQTLWSRGRGPMRGLRHSEVRATYLPMLALPSRSVLPRLCVTTSVPFPRLRLRCSSVGRGLVRVHPLKQNLT